MRVIIAAMVILILALAAFSPGSGSRAGAEAVPGFTALEERSESLARQAGLEKTEKELTSDLLAWNVKIEAARREQDRLRQEIPAVERSLREVEASLAESRASHEEGMVWLRRWVNHLYRCGPVTYLEVILGAADFNDFVYRYESVRIVIATQVNILDDLREHAARMREQAVALRQAQDELAAKSSLLAAQLKDMEVAKSGREEFLAGLRQQSAGLVERIVQAEKLWYHSVGSLHYLIAHLDAMPWANLAPDTFLITRTGLRLEFSDYEINRILFEQGDANLTGLKVHSSPGLFSISGRAAEDGTDFKLSGNFLLRGSGKVSFQPENLFMAGIPVSREVLGFISSDQGLAIDFGGFIPGYSLSEVFAEEGRLVVILSRF